VNIEHIKQLKKLKEKVVNKELPADYKTALLIEIEKALKLAEEGAVEELD
jgi:hypothetical protein